MNRDDKIKIITNILSNDEGQITEYILDIISNQSIEHTINKNGVFINLSVLSDDILDYICNVVISISNDTIIDIPNKETTTTKFNSSVINDELRKDNILLQSVDHHLLSLSKHKLTI